MIEFYVKKYKREILYWIPFFPLTPWAESTNMTVNIGRLYKFSFEFDKKQDGEIYVMGNNVLVITNNHGTLKWSNF